MACAVRFEEVTKRYSRGGPRYSSLRYELADGVLRLGARLRGQHPEPRGTLALDRVSFEVEEGEAFAIIGPNGAGKTTALKLVCRISYPTSGRVRVRGRVAALIEVGSGVHPELTARENIWLYGQMLGMQKSEVRHRFDEIVEFAELGHALDTVVKLYSSGMQLRLGFAIASHLDPDVFVVDEALAVGDAGFQFRCLERMRSLAREGRTLVFVSHDLKAVELLCSRAARLKEGKLVDCDAASAVVLRYLRDVHAAREIHQGEKLTRSSEVEFLSISTLDKRGQQNGVVQSGESITVRIRYLTKRPIHKPLFCVALTDGGGNYFTQAAMVVDGESPETINGEGYLDCIFDQLPLRPRPYEVWGGLANEIGALIVPWQKLAVFRVEDRLPPGARAVSVLFIEAPVKLPYRWRHTPLPDQSAAGSADKSG